MKRCLFIKETGNRCRAAVLPGEELCLFHSQTDKAKEARQRARDGSKRKSIYELTEGDRLRDLKWQWKLVKRDKSIGNAEKARLLGYLNEKIEAIEGSHYDDGLLGAAKELEPAKKPEEKKKQTFDEALKEEEEKEKIEHN